MNLLGHDPHIEQGNWQRSALWVLGVSAVLCCLWACGGRSGSAGGGRDAGDDSRKASQLQNAAEGSSGAQAAMLVLGSAMTPQLRDILEGAAAFTRATMGKAQRPAPAWTPERILGDPTSYRKAGESAERSANGTQAWFWLKVIGGSVGTVLVTVVGGILAKELPGVGPVLAKLAEGLWQGWTRKSTKQEDEARTVLASHASSVLEIASIVLPPSERARLIGQLPPEVVAAAARIGVIFPPAGSSPLPSIPDHSAVGA